jgi:hypothetical protein
MSAVDPAIFEGRYSFTTPSMGMEPMFCARQTISVDPARPIEPGRGVVLFKADRSSFIVREFVRSNQTQWVVRKYGDDYRSGKCPQGTEEKLLREEWPIAEFIFSVGWG